MWRLSHAKDFFVGPCGSGCTAGGVAWLVLGRFSSRRLPRVSSGTARDLLRNSARHLLGIRVRLLLKWLPYDREPGSEAMHRCWVRRIRLLLSCVHILRYVLYREH